VSVQEGSGAGAKGNESKIEAKFMETTVTILSDNCISASGFIGEHGFSVLIEREGRRFLFDTGQGTALPINLEKLQKSLKGLHRVFISHGHYDHTGGLKWVLEESGGVEIVAHPALFSKHMIKEPDKPDALPRHIGCPFERESLEELGASFHFVDRTTEIEPGIWFVTGFDRAETARPNDARLVLPDGMGYVADLMDDDASLLIETETSPVLILGCAHAGVVNIMNHVKRRLGIRKIRALLGGTHLMFCGPEQCSQFIKIIDEFSVDMVGASHCTGFRATVELAKHLGDRFTMAAAGAVFRF
jgi:7,8-dihydropterin-6-yl-methyl-4-(beta-D-ribofuranosyl)aminobenzene 5'-phosphate synthase